MEKRFLVEDPFVKTTMAKRVGENIAPLACLTRDGFVARREDYDLPKHFTPHEPLKTLQTHTEEKIQKITQHKTQQQLHFWENEEC